MELFNQDLEVLVKYLRGELPSDQQKLIANQLHDDNMHEDAISYLDAMLDMNGLTLDDDTEVIYNMTLWSSQDLLESMEKVYQKVMFEQELEKDIARLERKIANQVLVGI